MIIVAVCVGVEGVLQLADLGLIDVPRLRQWVYFNGSFFAGLLYDWRPNFPGQPFTMFVTYPFVHTGALHLALNMITLVIIGRDVIDRAGPARFAAIYAVSALGGAVAFGLLGPVVSPMVGASGALFGLAGAVVAWGWRDRQLAGESLGPIYRILGLLFLLNLIPWWIMQGHLAWQTHLGGFIAGVLITVWFDRRDATDP
ncbi:MAG: rhomboid family intramembrane serine protease [Pseudomonadota bacterium]